MNRNEFLEELRNALAGEIPHSEIESNISYYAAYIQQESDQKGEGNVLNELGDPRLIARTIIDTYRLKNGVDQHTYYQESYTVNEDMENSNSKSRHIRIDNIKPKWYHKLAIIGTIVGIFAIFIIISGAIINLLITIGIPVLIIFLIIRLFQRR